MTKHVFFLTITLHVFVFFRFFFSPPELMENSFWWLHFLYWHRSCWIELTDSNYDVYLHPWAKKIIHWYAKCYLLCTFTCFFHSLSLFSVALGINIISSLWLDDYGRGFMSVWCFIKEKKQLIEKPALSRLWMCFRCLLNFTITISEKLRKKRFKPNRLIAFPGCQPLLWKITINFAFAVSLWLFNWYQII